ncbi:hypothetical protein B0H14DRAFT_3152611 [Mycena olivaceomarginata]|nr:hypothetical protein B0H14DRAFT_3152611 [Mycena olivaceomarginata]
METIRARVGTRHTGSALSGAKGRDGWWLEIFVGDHCAVPKPRQRAVDGPGQMNYGGERVPDVRCGRNDDDHWGWWWRARDGLHPLPPARHRPGLYTGKNPWEQPAKEGPASTGFRPKPLQASRNATNANAIASTSASTTSSKPAAASKPAAVMPRPLTRPRPPVAARTTSRGASAPPVSTVTVRKPSSSRVPAASAAALGKRTALGGATTTAAAPDVITSLHKRPRDTRVRAHAGHRAARVAPRVLCRRRHFVLVGCSVRRCSSGCTDAGGAPRGAGAARQHHPALLANRVRGGAGGRSAREAAEADARRENLALKAEVLAGKTALAARAGRELRAPAGACARARGGGDPRKKGGAAAEGEAKDDLEECEGKLAKVRKELEGAVSGEVGMQERCRVLEGRAERLAGEVAQLQAEKTAWAVERVGWDVEREAWEVEKRRGGGGAAEPAWDGRCCLTSAEIAYPDAGLPYPSGQKEIVLSSTGAEREWDAGMGNKARREVWGFGFDRVFTPASGGEAVVRREVEDRQTSLGSYTSASPPPLKCRCLSAIGEYRLGVGGVHDSDGACNSESGGGRAGERRTDGTSVAELVRVLPAGEMGRGRKLQRGVGLDLVSSRPSLREVAFCEDVTHSPMSEGAGAFRGADGTRRRLLLGSCV